MILQFNVRFMQWYPSFSLPAILVDPMFAATVGKQSLLTTRHVRDVDNDLVDAKSFVFKRTVDNDEAKSLRRRCADDRGVFVESNRWAVLGTDRVRGLVDWSRRRRIDVGQPDHEVVQTICCTTATRFTCPIPRSQKYCSLGPFHGAIAVPSVTRCRCRGHRTPPAL